MHWIIRLLATLFGKDTVLFQSNILRVNKDKSASKLARGCDILTSQGGGGRQETCIIQDTYTKCKWICIAASFLQQLVRLVAAGSGEWEHLRDVSAK